LQFISLFDDTLDVLAPEDFRLVAELSEIVRWSNPDELAKQNRGLKWLRRSRR
jgi:hypothetical protein